MPPGPGLIIHALIGLALSTAGREEGRGEASEAGLGNPANNKVRIHVESSVYYLSELFGLEK